MATEKSDSMGDRLDNVLNGINYLKNEVAELHGGNVRIASQTIDSKIISIIKSQHELIVLLDHRVDALERSQKES